MEIPFFKGLSPALAAASRMSVMAPTSGMPSTGRPPDEPGGRRRSSSPTCSPWTVSRSRPRGVMINVAAYENGVMTDGTVTHISGSRRRCSTSSASAPSEALLPPAPPRYGGAGLDLCIRIHYE